MSRGLRRAGLMSKSFFYAVVVHIVVGVLLMFNLDWPTQVVSSPSSEPAPVQANVVSEAEIQEQKEAIREKEQAKERKQQEAQEKLEELLEKQEAEQERLAEIKQRQKEEAQKAEELARQKEQEAQELAKLKQKEEEERKKAEAEREAEEERQRKAEEERKRKEAEEQRRKEEQREKELAEERERQQELQEQLERERLQQRVNSALAQYIPIIKQKVSRNWNRPAGLGSRIEAHVTVRLSQSGEVLSARIVRSSGNPVFDRSVENAVLKASPLPIPQERGVNEEFRSIKLIFKPEEMIS